MKITILGTSVGNRRSRENDRYAAAQHNAARFAAAVVLGGFPASGTNNMAELVRHVAKSRFSLRFNARSVLHY